MGDVSHTLKWFTSKKMLKIGEVTKWCVRKHFYFYYKPFPFRAVCENISNSTCRIELRYTEVANLHVTSVLGMVGTVLVM